MVSELKMRFLGNNVVFTRISSLGPKSNTFLNLSIIQPLAAHFKLHIACLESELKFILKIVIRYQEENNCQIES